LKEDTGMSDDKKVKDIMVSIEEYDTIPVESALYDVLSILKANEEKGKSHAPGSFHKTIYVTDSSDEIIGKITMYDLIKGLVPDDAKEPKISRAFYSVFSSRALKVAEDVADIQTQFRWLHNTFFDLVKQEAHTEVKDIMSPVHPVLTEEDSINQAVFIMFKENIRQPLVVRDDVIIGVVNLTAVFDELLKIAETEFYST
jgi:CBS domain-containing protein